MHFSHPLIHGSRQLDARVTTAGVTSTVTLSRKISLPWLHLVTLVASFRSLSLSLCYQKIDSCICRLQAGPCPPLFLYDQQTNRESCPHYLLGPAPEPKLILVHSGPGSLLLLLLLSLPKVRAIPRASLLPMREKQEGSHSPSIFEG